MITRLTIYNAKCGSANVLTIDRNPRDGRHSEFRIQKTRLTDSKLFPGLQWKKHTEFWNTKIRHENDSLLHKDS
jgi:hypothetical protein